MAIWFAVMALPLAVMSFALIDINRASVEKRHLQDALDAAVLLVARSTATTDAQAQAMGSAALAAQLTGMSKATLLSSSFKIVGSKVSGTATSGLSPYISNLWLGGDMQVGAVSEATRAAINVELALVLDVTGSMAGSRLTDLKAAAKDLIDMVVSDSQSPYYSKAALVPYSVAVNVGGYAPSVRGAVVGTRSISGISWQSGATKNITGISKASSALVTSSNHGFQNGDVVYISGVNGMTQVNDKYYTVSNAATNNFRLFGTSSSFWSTYTSGGIIRKCQVSDCSLVVTTSAAHGYANGDDIYFSGVGGLTALNGNTYSIANTTSTTFSLVGVLGPTSSVWTSGGTSYCTTYGCEFQRFTNASSTPQIRMHQINTCATERTGAYAYTDTAPGIAPVGANYPSSGNACPTAMIMPLSTNRTALKAQIDTYAAAGSTAGQIGVEWGWYMVSPNFASLWPVASQPAAYSKPDLLKAVVIMTDGEFNSPYCQGVIARNAGSGSGSTSDKINCDATNGQGAAQALRTCTAMKNAGVVVYTVGLGMAAGGEAETLLKNCATSSAHLYLPSSGGALKDAFSAIGRDIMKLRLSK
ncbi:MAG: ubiquitin-activating E1 FCCH domain-containing protein [Caulobacter sp.]|nr:ubiquitin-activating E1 FCCH domain-containing protein [Caulobacter sp.]